MLAVKPLFAYKPVMKRDTLKTIFGLVIIGLIVVVTFLYGNAQRQAQLRHDQDVKRQQQTQAKTPAVQPTATATSQPKTAAPTATPAAPTATPAAPSTKPPVAPTAAPAAGATNTTKIPDTGASENALIPITLLGLAVYGLRRSRRALALAVRSR